MMWRKNEQEYNEEDVNELQDAFSAYVSIFNTLFDNFTIVLLLDVSFGWYIYDWMQFFGQM